MKGNNAIVFGSAIALIFATFNVISSEDGNVNIKTETDETKSVAWYVANISAARQKNQSCHDNPDIKNSDDCNNALHALQISFNGAN